MRLRWLIGILLLVVLIGGGFFWYAQSLSRQLLVQQRQLIRFYAEALKYMASAPEECIPTFFWEYLLPDPQTGKRLFLPPMVVTNDKGQLLTHNLEETYRVPRNRVRDLSSAIKLLQPDTSTFPPVVIVPASGSGPLRIYYGEPLVLRRLRWMPLFSALMVMLIGIGWVAAVYVIARYRQNRLWVGLTREAAHQIGTPLSGLMGTVELLQESPAQLPQLLPLLQKDLERIQDVVDRFSKIGAPPQLRVEPLQPLLAEIVDYFRRRLPHAIEISLRTPDKPLILPYNRTTLRWVLENLIRNALDALPSSGGKVQITLLDRPQEAVIRVSDTGRGMAPGLWEAIFRPGFTTKRSGWGIGLTLARRIVEEYHHGAIFVRQSSPQGTTFEVRLPKKTSRYYLWRRFWQREVLRRWWQMWRK